MHDRGAREFGRPMIVGVEREYFGAEGREIFNTAVLVTPDGSWCEPGRREQSYYDKMHLVPFGEYMPFAKICPGCRACRRWARAPVRASGPSASMLKRYMPGAEHLLRDRVAARDSEPIGRACDRKATSRRSWST